MTDTILCNKRTPSVRVSPVDCRFSYKMAIDDPGNHLLAACAQCDRGKSIFFSSPEAGGKTMGSYKKKVCVDCQKSGQVKDDRCYKCYKAKHGKSPFPCQGGNKIPPKTRTAGKVKPRRNGKGNAAEVAPETPGLALPVDFSAYPAVHARLVSLAREEHRTPELQILHIVQKKFDVEDLKKPETTKAKRK